MIHPLLEKYIPSRSYVAYLKEIDANFTKFETAAILHHIGLPPMGTLAAYRTFLPDVTDGELRRQITAEIEYMEREQAIFRKGGGDVVFLAVERDEYESLLGVAANYETAYELGIRSGEAFKIRKHRLLPEYPEARNTEKYYLNPYFSDDEDLQDCVKTCKMADFGFEIGSASFEKDGSLYHLYSQEMEASQSNKENLEHLYSHKLFTNAYIDYPNPFECGDLVEFVHPNEAKTFGDLGVVNTSQADWAKYSQKVRNGTCYDQSDACITVEWLTEDGRFSHDHNPFIFLERGALRKEMPRPLRELLRAGSEMMRGVGSLEWYVICMENYREWLRKEKEHEQKQKENADL